MKHFKKGLLIAGAVIVVLLIVLGTVLYRTFPAYPAFQKDVESYAKTQKMLSDCDATADLTVVDPADFGMVGPSHCYVLLDGRTLNARPAGYLFLCNVDNERLPGLTSIEGRIASESDLFHGTNYHGAETQLLISDLEESNIRQITLRLCCEGYLYVLDGEFNTKGLSKEACSEREDQLVETLYQIVDMIISQT